MIASFIDPTPLSPSDLDVLQRVFDAICAEARIDRTGKDAERIAGAIIARFQGGTMDESELLTHSRSSLALKDVSFPDK